MKCPRDHSDLVIRDTEGHIGYFCGTCHGAWLPSKYQQSIEYMRHFSHAEFVAKLAPHLGTPGQLACPSGCGVLTPVVSPRFTLSWCPSCHGAWFEQGEIAHLLNQHGLREKPYPQVAAEQTAWGLLVGPVAGILP